jgi:heptosyltransferase-3
LLDYARAIACDTRDTVPRVVPTDADERIAAELMRVHDISGPFAILHPTRGLSAARARWPIEGFVELVHALSARESLPLLITGSQADAAIAVAIAHDAGRPAIAIAGAAGIGAFAALARRAAYVVAMDSGPMHVAAATGTPTVGIFALQSDEPDRWAPLGRATAVVRATYPCPPGHRKETCPDFACVRALEVPAIVATLGRLRAAARA